MLESKPRHGSASHAAFVIEQPGNDRQPAVFAVTNGMKGEPATFEALRMAMDRDDFLVQPLRENHQLFVPLCPSGDAVTLRNIT